jgi:small subunit ribosomal protein S20
MPNIKSAKKRVLVSKAENASNRAIKTGVKTQIKKFDAAVRDGSGAADAMRVAVSGIDKAVAKGVLHKNTAARKKSQLARKLNATQ